MWRSLQRSIKPVKAEPIHSGAKDKIPKNLPNTSPANNIKIAIKPFSRFPDDVSGVGVDETYLSDILHK